MVEFACFKTQGAQIKTKNVPPAIESDTRKVHQKIPLFWQEYSLNLNLIEQNFGLSKPSYFFPLDFPQLWRFHIFVEFLAGPNTPKNLLSKRSTPRCCGGRTGKGLEMLALELPSRELTYHTIGKGKSSTQKHFGKGYSIFGRWIPVRDIGILFWSIWTIGIPQECIRAIRMYHPHPDTVA